MILPMFQWEVSTFWTNKSVIKCTYSERAIKIWRNLHILFEITLQRQKLFGHFRIYKLYLARLATDFRDPFERIKKKNTGGPDFGQIRRKTWKPVPSKDLVLLIAPQYFRTFCQSDIFGWPQQYVCQLFLLCKLGN